jgi:hypothetical protein
MTLLWATAYHEAGNAVGGWHRAVKRESPSCPRRGMGVVAQDTGHPNFCENSLDANKVQ